MTAPKRIQLRRVKGWRKPEGAIVVARPSKWGNPFKVGGPVAFWIHPHDVLYRGGTVEDAGHAVAVFRSYARVHFVAVKPDARPYHGIYTHGIESLAQHARRILPGHDLACWCPLDQPCHADVLLELANPGWRP